MQGFALQNVRFDFIADPLVDSLLVFLADGLLLADFVDRAAKCAVKVALVELAVLVQLEFKVDAGYAAEHLDTMLDSPSLVVVFILAAIAYAA